MTEEQNTNISDSNITDLNKEVSGILNTPKPGEEPVFKKSDSNISPIRTYKQDYSDLVKNKNIGQLEMVSAEIHRGYGSKEESSEFEKKKITNIILPILILAALGIAGYLAYLIFAPKAPAVAPKQLAQIPPPLIFSEKQESVVLKDATKNELNGEIRRTLQKPFSNNSVVYLPIIKDEVQKETYIDLNNFLEISQLNLPADLSQSTENSYMMGLLSKNEKYPFLILKIKLYENAFAGMIAWENKISSDMANIWPVKKTTSSDKFIDKTINNRDVRELHDQDGNLVLIYSFLDRNTLVIATNEEALKAVFERFTFR